MLEYQREQLNVAMREIDTAKAPSWSDMGDGSEPKDKGKLEELKTFEEKLMNIRSMKPNE